MLNDIFTFFKILITIHGIRLLYKYHSEFDSERLDDIFAVLKSLIDNNMCSQVTHK